MLRRISLYWPVAVCLDEEGMRLSIGARPGRAALLKEKMDTPVNKKDMSAGEWNRQAELLAKKGCRVRCHGKQYAGFQRVQNPSGPCSDQRGAAGSRRYGKWKLNLF